MWTTRQGLPLKLTQVLQSWVWLGQVTVPTSYAQNAPFPQTSLDKVISSLLAFDRHMRKQMVAPHAQPHYILRLCQILAVGTMSVNIRFPYIEGDIKCQIRMSLLT